VYIWLSLAVPSITVRAPPNRPKRIPKLLERFLAT
jgi:hypothetical protein